MARNNRKGNIFSSNKKVNNYLDFIRRGLTDIHKDVYQSSPEDEISATKLKDNINNNVNDINSVLLTGNNTVGGMSRIYSRLNMTKINSDDIGEAMNIFSDERITQEMVSVYQQNTWVKNMDREIDLVVKYMPKLQEALNAKKDCVLSADHYSKDFLNYHTIISSKGKDILSKNMEYLRKRYRLNEFYEELYMNTQKYGEQFVYIVPYNIAIKRLLKDKANTSKYSLESSENVVFENYTTVNIDGDDIRSDIMMSSNSSNSIFTESVTIENTIVEESADGLSNYVSKDDINISIQINKDYIISEAVLNVFNANRIKRTARKQSLSEAHISHLNGDSSLLTEKNGLDKTISDELKVPDEINDGLSTSSDGLVTNNDGKTKIDVPGCVVKVLDRGDIIPIYIEDICMGYYYFEYISQNPLSVDPISGYNDSITNFNTLGGAFNSTTTSSIQNADAGQRDRILSYISKRISDVIDTNFINANQDLRKEIYMILKHNDKFNGNYRYSGNIRVSFIPSDDVIHMKFKTDPITHRGISDLAYSLFPAKLYSSLYITQTLGILTRGNDKRVYYVKQNIDTNISATLLSVVNQIKKGNFGARQMESLNSILNITGQFNDMLIPVSPNGDEPIRTEVIQGQQFQSHDELLNKLEELAVNMTDMPIEFINARKQLDYAIQATMTNSTVSRVVTNRQDLVEEFLSEITTRIYNYEFDDNLSIEVVLPAPAFLRNNNDSQTLQTIKSYATEVAGLKLSGESEEVKEKFIDIATSTWLGSHLDSSEINNIITKAKLEVARDAASKQEQ